MSINNNINTSSISWNEIKSRTLEFQKTWIGEKRERAEKDTFWNEFFAIFGINRRRVASFETAVRKLNNKQGFIDCFWEGVILIEHKSFGKDLDKAFVQATDYFTGLTDAQLPKYILVSDFDQFHLYNLDDKTDVAFALSELLENIELFGFLAGYANKDLVAEDPVNIQASVLMGNLHDSIRETGYQGYELEVFLTRILFVLFAEDTQIFERCQFLDFIENRTSVDGFDTGIKIGLLFDNLNKPLTKRLNNLDEEIAKFPYINGGLFAERIEMPQFDSKTRLKLIECARFDWSKISPAVFGSLFQSVMNPEQRRTFGAHYTEEKNILKTIEPLFLDDLWLEFDNCKSNKKKLQEFHIRLSKLTFLDPACGCGNFLIVTYREIRDIELQVILKLHDASVQALDVSNFSIVNVDQFYGIEIEEFPAQIAKTAMWLMDHIANLELSKAFGQYYARIPLTTSATILHGNSLTTDWNDVIKAENLSFIIGNPPFVGSKMLNQAQRQEIQPIIGHIKNSGILDYVCNWYVKASAMMRLNNRIQTAFVSTNSICQGEQVGVLWGYLVEQCSISIKFAHQTFAWSSEAKGKANVFCVIVGFEIENTKLSNNVVSQNSPALVKGWQPQVDGVVTKDKDQNSLLVGVGGELAIYNSPSAGRGGTAVDGVAPLPYNPKLKQKARELRQAGNLSEVLFWNVVKNKQLLGFDFDRQKIIGNYIVDFYCCKTRLVVEIDGESHDYKGEYDVEREKYLVSLGLEVIHFQDIEIKKHLGSVLESLYSHLEAKSKLLPRQPTVATPSQANGNFAQVLPRQTLSATPSRVQGNFANIALQSKSNSFSVAIPYDSKLPKTKKLYTYTSPKADPVLKLVSNINPYLVECGNVIIKSRSKPICDVPEMNAGNVAYDYGYLIFSEIEMNEFVAKEPLSAKWFKKLIGGQELINGGMRYCLWLLDILPNELRQMKHVLDRIEKVKVGRMLAKDSGTHKLASRSSQFRDLNNPKQFIAIPKTSSENREYIPIAIFDQEYIPSDSIRFIETSSLFHFGILTSKMHMAWVKVVCGRLKSDFRYSKDIVYNNFPFPDIKLGDKNSPSVGRGGTAASRNSHSRAKGWQPQVDGVVSDAVSKVETLAQNILDIRLRYTGSSLADLYDPLTMSPDLAKAHADLDRAVEKLYLENSPLEGWTRSGRGGFLNDEERVAFLFEMYEEIVGKFNK